jgi:NAD(P)-dependent dehydrogenase (short-subunit alcohol dehydrogenase family)
MVIDKQSSSRHSRRRIIVTGASRGLGRAMLSSLIKQGHEPVGLSRWDSPENAAERDLLLSEGFPANNLVNCDLSEVEQITAACDSISQSGSIDGIISNAGVYLDDMRKGPAPDILTVSRDIMQRSFQVNVWAHLQLVQTLLPKMNKQGHGRILIVSSGMGRCCEVEDNAPAYRLSKSCSLMLARLLGRALQETQITVNAACPGWTKTRMGGPKAVIGVAEAAADVLHTYFHPEGLPPGSLIRHGRELRCDLASASDRLPLGELVDAY